MGQVGRGSTSSEPVELYVNLPSPDARRTERITQRVWGAVICPECVRVRGSLVVQGYHPGCYEQWCRCDRERRSEPDERWVGWDFNTFVELCRSCTIEPIRSGSRWSLFFCKECRERVLHFNRRHRRWIIPMGRHSLMHGDWLSADESALEEHVAHFVARVHGLWAATEHLDHWTSATTRRNLDTLGFSNRSEIDLGLYVKAARARGLEKQAAFDKLIEHFADTE
jgi:hypothetical protein